MKEIKATLSLSSLSKELSFDDLATIFMLKAKNSLFLEILNKDEFLSILNKNQNNFNQIIENKKDSFLIYSIIKSDWSTVKSNIESLIELSLYPETGLKRKYLKIESFTLFLLRKAEFISSYKNEKEEEILIPTSNLLNFINEFNIDNKDNLLKLYTNINKKLIDEIDRLLLN